MLTDEQSAAFNRLATLAGAGAFHPAVLHGVTGSGKTEIYLRLANVVHARGRGVLLLVPEIALTPVDRRRRSAAPSATASRSSTAGSRTASATISGSGSGGGEVDVVVGTRSAVFAPLHAARA